MFCGVLVHGELSAGGSRRAGRLNIILVVNRRPGGSKAGGLSDGSPPDAEDNPLTRAPPV